MAPEVPATFIADLRPSRVATIEATVTALDPPRDVPMRDGGTQKVRNGRLKDSTGEIAFVLWGAEVELAQVGDRIRISDGWVKEYQGKPQISLGRQGKLQQLPKEG